MKRLTQKDEYGNADIIGVDSADLQLNLGFDEFNLVTDALNRLAFYEDAHQNGRLLVLPCKVGDTVYTAQRGEVSELRVDHLELYNDGIWVSWRLMSGLYGYFRMHGFPASDIGKTVFLTREEAEKALEKGGKR